MGDPEGAGCVEDWWSVSMAMLEEGWGMFTGRDYEEEERNIVVEITHGGG